MLLEFLNNHHHYHPADHLRDHQCLADYLLYCQNLADYLRYHQCLADYLRYHQCQADYHRYYQLPHFRQAPLFQAFSLQVNRISLCYPIMPPALKFVVQNVPSVRVTHWLQKSPCSNMDSLGILMQAKRNS